MNTSSNGPIISGTDFSEGASQAAIAADALARRLGTPCILVRSADERADFGDEFRDGLMEANRPRLKEEADRLRNLGLTLQEQVLHGGVDRGVAAFAAQENARLVVVGASGRGSLWASRWVLGNVTERIAETSSVPTLVVRHADPLVAWARGERPLKIFIAVDFTATSEAAMRWVGEWQTVGLCEITLGYVHAGVEERSDFAVFEGIPLPQISAQTREGLERDLRDMATRLLGGSPAVRVVQRSARVDAHLLALAVDAGADLLVIGAHQWRNLGRMWHGGISRRILKDAPMNVVTVPVPVVPEGVAAVLPAFRRVLVATDFSELANHAIPYAWSAVAPGGTVCLVHFAQPGKASEKSETETRLRALIPADAVRRGMATEIRVLESLDAGSAICEAADRYRADLVCIGSHGHGGIAAAVMGSVAQKVMALSRSPVLLVRPPQA